MGICFSKKKQKPSSNRDSPLHKRNPPSNDPNKKQIKQVNKEENKFEPQSPKKIVAEKLKNSISISHVQKKEKPNKQEELEANTSNVITISKPEETRTTATPVRASSCTKEEVDAILLQCGRLSRNSSQKRKHSDSKRSFDFDNEKREEEEEEENVPIVSRPSPRRRTPSRERSGSKERGNQRRVSRSPNRRLESEKAKQQPVKMVSVPAREKSTANKRNASPSNCGGRILNENRSGNQMSLSRSNSKKAEQSNFERDPMVEIDENLSKKDVVGNVSKVLKSREGDDDVRRAVQIQTQCNGIKSSSNTATTNSNVQLNISRTREKQQSDTNTNLTLTRTRSSRQSSRDLDNIISGTNANVMNYTSFLLEDIQNYHQQNTGFLLPACVSKAHSILEAVADLNSSSSDQSYVKRGLNVEFPFVETEIHVKDDLTEPTIHKYISVSELRKESEPQESAGSNSLVAQSWHSSWEFNSLDSTDRVWNTKCSKGEEEGEESSNVGSRGMKCKRGGSSISSSSSRLMSATKSSTCKKKEVDHNRRVGARKASSLLPVAAASY